MLVVLEMLLLLLLLMLVVHLLMMKGMMALLGSSGAHVAQFLFDVLSRRRRLLQATHLRQTSVSINQSINQSVSHFIEPIKQ